MIALYIIVTYLIMFGMLIEYFTKSRNVPKDAWIAFILSPITFPVIIGMNIADKRE